MTDANETTKISKGTKSFDNHEVASRFAKATKLKRSIASRAL